MNVRIVLDPDYIPQKYRLSPMLSEILDMKLETKPQVIMGLWNYIKVKCCIDYAKHVFDTEYRCSGSWFAGYRR